MCAIGEGDMLYFIDVMCEEFMRSLRDSLGFKCGSSTVALARHSSSRSVLWRWKLALVLLR